MKTIMTVCGTGLGSSFVVEMNIREIMREWNMEDHFLITHGAVFEVNPADADYFITAKDLEDSIAQFPNLIVLESIIDQEELRDKLYKLLREEIKRGC